MSDAERAECGAAAVEVEVRLRLAELAYKARIAGLSLTQMARRVGNSAVPVISLIERGAALAPGGVVLARIANALGDMRVIA